MRYLAIPDDVVHGAGPVAAVVFFYKDGQMIFDGLAADTTDEHVADVLKGIRRYLVIEGNLRGVLRDEV